MKRGDPRCSDDQLRNQIKSCGDYVDLPLMIAALQEPFIECRQLALITQANDDMAHREVL